MKNISTIFVAALMTGACGLVAQTEATPNELFGKVKISLADGLNTPDLEFSPIYFNNGLIFTSDRLREGEKVQKVKGGTKGYTDLFFSEKDGEVSFKAPKRIGKLNTKYHDGIASYSEADQKLYFTRNNQKGTILDTKKAKRLKIFVSSYIDNEWTEPKEVSFNVEKYSTCHPAISKDGKTMYFASNRPGGHGGMDIYVTYFENGDWTEPVNMGSDINTDKNEIFPFNDVNGTLYFSSEGHYNMGGLDIFMAQEVVNPHMTEDNNWEISNIGEPFNSFADDFGFVGNAGGDKGYFSSGRGGGMGRDDIYGWEIVPETPEALVSKKQIKVIDSKTGKELPFTDIVLSEPNSPGNVLRYTTAENGMIELDWTNDRNYFISTEKVGYVAYNKLHKATEMNGDVIVIPIDPREEIVDARVNKKPTKVIAEISTEEPVEATKEEMDHYFAKEETPKGATLEAGQLIELQHIYYEFDKYNLKESAKAELDRVVDLMRQYPDMEIDLNSHTDSRGSDAYNMWLSDARAKSAVEYIISQGIEARRITAKGYGEGQPVNECRNNMKCTSDKHQMNRRTEFLIKNMGEKSILKSNTSQPKKMTFQWDGNVPQTFPVIESVFYAPSAIALSDANKQSLRRIASMMKKHDGMTIQLAAYTDDKGNAEFNQLLSEKRANRVMTYLSSQGVQANRISIIAHGENHNDNLSNDHSRRTDIMVTNPGNADLTAWK